MRSEYRPLRDIVKEANDTASSYKERLERVEKRCDELEALVRKVLTAERRVRRGRDGSPEGVDVVSGDEVLAQLGVVRGRDGLVSGVR